MLAMLQFMVKKYCYWDGKFVLWSCVLWPSEVHDWKTYIYIFIYFSRYVFFLDPCNIDFLNRKIKSLALCVSKCPDTELKTYYDVKQFALSNGEKILHLFCFSLKKVVWHYRLTVKKKRVHFYEFLSWKCVWWYFLGIIIIVILYFWLTYVDIHSFLPGSNLCSYDISPTRYPGHSEQKTKCPKLPVPPR